MEDLKLLSFDDLLDLMIEQTAHHTSLILVGATPHEFEISREILRELQAEIYSRRANEQSPHISSQDQSPLEAAG